MPRQTIHLIGNAHLDPVWLWDRREGLNEGISTVRTILELMDEFPEMTFIRGEAAIYQHIEKKDPSTFARIKKMVKAGRWDVVGGTFIQPDTNLAGTETLVRQYACGKRYFKSRFGKEVTAGWQADSFGHTAGLPEILAASGINFFAFSRPQASIVPLAEPAFWWLGDGGARILAYRSVSGSYLNERHDIQKQLDIVLEASSASRLENTACFYGLGNHGGGPSRRHLLEIRDWAAKHPEVKVIHSGLHKLNDALRRELSRKGDDLIPTHQGELNYCLRGCYSSVAKFKFPYRRSEALLARAEATDAIIAASQKRPAEDLSATWDTLLFNSFHDILPGSSIERAIDEQIHSLGSILHQASETESDAINALAADIDTTLTRKPPKDHPSAVTAIVWNPHPFPLSTQVEVEACLDYRPLAVYENRDADVPVEVLGANRKPVAFQIIRNEHSSFASQPWRKRVVVPVNLSAFGWNVLEMGYVEGAKPLAVKNPVMAKPGSIANDLWRVEVEKGGSGVQFFHHGKRFFAGDGLQAVLFDDPWGSWGGMVEEPDSFLLKHVREHWKITGVELLETGPERAALWVRFAGKKSRIDLTFHVSRDRDAVDVSARVLLDDRSARLKLVFPAGDQVDYEVPGSVVHRGPAGEVPGARWARVHGKNGGMGFASDALYNFDSVKGEFRATVARATRYANDVHTHADSELWRPAVDCGELKFRFLVTDAMADLPRHAAFLEQAPVVLMVPPGKGQLKRTGSLLELTPSSARLLALKRAEDGRGFVLRAQAAPGKPANVSARWLGQNIPLGTLGGSRIGTWRFHLSKGKWIATQKSIHDIHTRPHP
ncbi:MAG: glycoside hydrolase family 38 C-terminal domain-containing protein [Verrucomicrobiota bacterium]